MSRQLPSGTITFLFTDVEGSTKLLRALGDERYAEALAEHRRLLREAFERHDGVEVDTQGDAFFVAFPTAEGALAAAGEGLRALESGPIRVRIGLHTGTPVLTEEGYVGEDVHRAARIAAAGHGGQVLISASTAALVGPEDSGLFDLGEHRFKDLARPERVYQLGDRTFPRIRSLSPTNLPVPTTPFLGRQDELEVVRDLLSDDGVRVLTLTGPGGTGKTRLAIHAAAEVSDGFPDGLWWVALAGLQDPGLALSEIAFAAGIEEPADRPIAAALGDGLAGKRTLVLLDNAEHLLPRLADELAPVIGRATTATFLVTSREPLHLQAEREVPIPSMNPEDALAFFRARAEAAGVPLNGAAAVAEICERLDRLPLAMQLAAARLKLFSPEQLLERLSSLLDLKGGRDADPRQRTLRAAIEWSHDLLDGEERELFRRLAVFAGGAVLEAVETVCEADEDVLLSLVDKSLVRRRDDAPEPRFWMLETIREFALERLEGSDEAERLRGAHAEWVATFVLRADDGMHRPGDRAPVLDRMDRELDNIRVALTWARDRGKDEPLQTIAGGLRLYWQLRSMYREGWEWLDRARAGTGTDPFVGFRILDGLSSLAYRRDEAAFALELAEEALPLAAATGDEREMVTAETNVGNALTALARHADAETHYDTALEIAEQLGDAQRIATALNNRGDLATIVGRYEEAAGYLRRALDAERVSGDSFGAAVALQNLSTVSFLLDRTDEAEELAIESVDRMAQADLCAIALIVHAGVAARRGDAELAGELLGASASIRASTGYQLEPAEQRLLEQIRNELGSTLDEPRPAAAFERGSTMDPAAALRLARRS